MPVFVDFSGRNIGSVVRFVEPNSLAALQGAIIQAENDGLAVHAVGSGWAFSAPAYCEGVMIRPDGLTGFPGWLQETVIQPADPSRLFVAVECGVSIRDLYRGLVGQRPDGRNAPADLRDNRELTPPTLGGAGGQRLAGATCTGTHGGDVRRPPIGDFVQAVVLVGSGGTIRLVQRPQDPAVDTGRALQALRARVRQGTAVVAEPAEMFDAAVLSVGRLGVVYAYVFEVHDERGFFIFENRRKRPWRHVRGNLLADVQSAATTDDYLGVVVNPVIGDDGDRMCYLARRKKLPRARIRDAGLDFGLGEVGSVPVGPERARSPLSGDIGQALCANELTHPLAVVRDVLIAAGIVLTVTMFPFGIIAAAPLFEIASSIGRISPRHRLGDVIADALRITNRVGVPDVLEAVNRGLLDSAQSDRLPTDLFGPDRGPWLVHGPRWEIADSFDYDNDCYRGDSIEVFFPVDAALIDTVEALFDVLADLRREGRPVGAYIALRFMAPSRSLLAAAAFTPSCSVEISMLRGLDGNTDALNRIQQLTLARGGRVHWGQENSLDRAAVDRTYGPAVAAFRTQLARVEGDSSTFSNPFSRSHGLEPDRPQTWRGWTETGLVTSGPPAVASASRVPLEVFAVDQAGLVRASVRPATAAAGPWRTVRPEPVAPGATPAVTRNNSDATELFVRGQDHLRHTWEQNGPGSAFAGWSTMGAFLWNPGARIDRNPAIGQHADGRLEVFAREFPSDGQRLLHAWQGLLWIWTGFNPMWDEPRLGRQPSVGLRRHLEGVSVTDQLVVVTSTENGTVIWTGQTGPGGDSGWTPLAAVTGADRRPMQSGGAGSPLIVDVTGPGARLHIFVTDPACQVHEAVDEDRTVAITWLPWQPLPPLTGLNRIDPASRLATAQSQHLWLFGRSLRGHVMTIEFTPGTGWNRWIDLGGDVSGDLAAGAFDAGRVEVFARRASDNQLMSRRQISATTW